MFNKTLAIAALALATASVAHADPISGYFSANGTDTFTSNSVTFAGGAVAGSIGGTFASYITDGTTVNFLPGTLPYAQGVNTPPLAVYPTGLVPIFSVTGNGETFTFEMQQYNAGYVVNNPSALSGCNVGSTCLNVTGIGFYVGTGAFAGTSGPATFTFSSQYVAGQPLTTTTTFSASTAALAPSPVPEPSSLVLLGSGILGVAGAIRRKISA